MTTENQTEKFDANDMDVEGGDNVGGPRHPFLNMGPEGGSGCNYKLELVQSRWWRKPVTNGKKGVKGPQRFNYTARVLASEGEGATLPGTLVGLLFAEPESGHEFYLRDAKACAKAFTGGALTDSAIANTLFNPDTTNTFLGAMCAVQVTRNAKNPQYPVYTFDGPIERDVADDSAPEPEQDLA